MSCLVSDNPRISVSTGDSRFRHLTIVSLTLLGYPFEGYIRAIQARSAMAHWDILSPTLLPLILRYCLGSSVGLDRTRFSRLSKMKVGR
jgi:hypothetical protein